jgi:hypothetical protein
MIGAATRGGVGQQIEIAITETLVPFELVHLRNWRAGKRFDLIPEEEQPRRERFVAEAQRRHHFGELSAMHAFKRDGYRDWLYEDYLLFREPPRGEVAAYARGTARAHEVLGEELAQRLRHAAELYAPATRPPIEPDLMAWRDEGGARQFRFVEVKLEFKEKDKSLFREKVDATQLLGMALITAVVPNVTVEIHRYIDLDRYGAMKKAARGPTAHRLVFAPRRAGAAAAAGGGEGQEAEAGAATEPVADSDGAGGEDQTG